jgi:hypothetical protein
MRKNARATAETIPATQHIAFAAGWLLAAMIALTVAAHAV